MDEDALKKCEKRYESLQVQSFLQIWVCRKKKHFQGINNFKKNI